MDGGQCTQIKNLIIGRECQNSSQPKRSRDLVQAPPMASMLVLSSPTATSPLTYRPTSRTTRRHCTGTIFCKAKNANTGSSDGGGGGTSTVELAAAVGGVVSIPVISYSLYTLKTTGCGLPPGPGGSLGALEGVSYLALAGIVGWSVYTKAKTGSGLPAGPFGLLGAVEGLSYLTALAVVLVFGLEFVDKGSLPGPLPDDKCFG